MRLFQRKNRHAVHTHEKYVNVTHVEPFGYLLSEEDYPTAEAARAEATPSALTMRVSVAHEMLAADARDARRRDYVKGWIRRFQENLDDLAFLKAQSAGRTEPVEAVGDLPEMTWQMLQTARLALAESGRVRPHLLPSGRVSTTEIEVTLTAHEIEVLLMRVGRRSPDRSTPDATVPTGLKLSVQGEKVNP